MLFTSMVIVSYFRKHEPPKRGENRGEEKHKDASLLVRFLAAKKTHFC